MSYKNFSTLLTLMLTGYPSTEIVLLAVYCRCRKTIAWNRRDNFLTHNT